MVPPFGDLKHGPMMARVEPPFTALPAFDAARSFTFNRRVVPRLVLVFIRRPSVADDLGCWVRRS
jgi:hypothetical protein